MNNIAYIEQLYQLWRRDPAAVSRLWDAYFREALTDAEPPAQAVPAPAAESGKQDMAYRQSRVNSLLWAYRDVGYIYARLNPLGDRGPSHDYLQQEDAGIYERLTLEQFGISPEDLDTEFFAGPAMQPSHMPLRDILAAYQETYCGPIGVEFLHIQDKRIRRWLIRKMESVRNRPSLDADQKRTILTDLLRTEALERMMGQSFVGQKRFSLEGSEAIIPGLHFLVDSAGRYGIEDFVIGTTHRGRLAILHTILHMSPQEIFSRFDENFVTEQMGGSGDVKYHVGYETDHILDEGGTVHISMAANASHLESIDPVVEGKARAIQDRKGDRDRKRVVPILLHGDAAFSGQGIVAETLNLSRLKGYTTGGTIHIIINNQIGFTTSSRDARSTVFPTDAAKGLAVPIFHVNGDDPEALVYAGELALQFRDTFACDCILDVFCYRRHGHNETDEPSFTHPYMYRLIGEHPGVSTIYGRRCARKGIMSEQEQSSFTQAFVESLHKALEDSRSEPISFIDTTQGPAWADVSGPYTHEPVDTTFDAAVLERAARHLLAIPEGFHAHRTLERMLDRKRRALDDQGTVDWAMAESLAFAALLLEGVPVRLSGEDCVRGTFSQRHLTWWDVESAVPRPYSALQTLEARQAELAAYDSPLSEYSVLGFEYGYSVTRPDALVIWEAQFGDFANGAQVIIDNYVTSAQSKWGRKSGLVMLLPHANEGQGPDHSSGRVERFLELAACDNIQVCNLTTAAQYFHLLRRQVRAPYRKPLIIMAPKSLLRHPKVACPLRELAEGTWREVIDDGCRVEPVRRVALCSGKVYYDLLDKREAAGNGRTAVIRVEQLYPFPEESLRAVLERYANAREVIWVQEEPRNFGPWRYMLEQFARRLPDVELGYIGRGECPSGGSGSFKQYQQEQQQLVEDVFGHAMPQSQGPSGSKENA